MAGGEPLGWNVYYGTGSSMRFDHFEPNEPEVARRAAHLADDVEAFLAGGDEQA